MSNLKIICDSLADVPEELIKKYDVEVVPLSISLHGIEYKHGVNISNEEFYKKIRATDEMPKTSQATYAQFEEVFRKYIEQGRRILYISASSKVTGTCQSAMMARNELDELDGEIHIFDSLNLSFGIGAQVVTACEMNAKKYSIEEIIKKLEYIRDNIFVLFAVDTLEYLKKGGRLSTPKAVIGSMLSMKPILHMEDGLIKNLEVVRGKKKEISKMIELTKEYINGNLDNKRIAIGDGDNSSDFEKLQVALKEELNTKDLLSVEIGASIGCHTGPGTIGICVWDK